MVLWMALEFTNSREDEVDLPHGIGIKETLEQQVLQASQN